MPVRDAAPWLADAIESLVDQTESDWELVAVDDGSTDESKELLAGYARADDRIRLMTTSPERRGLVAALNLGLEQARAPLLARMDADDVADRERLALQRAALDADEDLFAVSCRVRAFPEAAASAGMQRYLAWQNALVTPEEIARDRFVESPVLHPSLVFRRPILQATLGGWRERGWPEDWDLLLRALGMGLKIGRVEQVLLRWRLHPRQTTRTSDRYAADRLLAVRAHYLAAFLHATAGARPVWVLGAGPVGKTLTKQLASCGLVAAGLVDVDPRKIGGIVRDGDRAWSVIRMEDLWERSIRPFAVAAVGRPGGRARVRDLLVRHGWVELEDFVVAA